MNGYGCLEGSQLKIGDLVNCEATGSSADLRAPLSQLIE
jgi:hypothetical protein